MTQNQIAIQSLRSWIEKIAANANTSQLDALEQQQITRFLNTLMGTRVEPVTEITLDQNKVISDIIIGTLVVNLPVSKVEGSFVCPSFTSESSNTNKVTLMFRFVPDETATDFTVGDALTLFNGIANGLIGGPLVLTWTEFMIMDYLRSISTQLYNPISSFVLEIDFNSKLTKFDFKDTAFPSIGTPILTLPVVSELTADSATVTGTYDYTGRRVISEVGVILSQTGEADVEIPSQTIASTFTVALTNLVDDVLYGVRTYIKFTDGGGYASEVISLEGKDLPNVTSVAAADITTTTATLGGTFVYNAEEGVGAITETGVEYKIDGGVYAAVAAAGTTSPISVAMTELTLGSKYYFKAYVKIGADTYYGNELTFDTLAE